MILQDHPPITFPHHYSAKGNAVCIKSVRDIDQNTIQENLIYKNGELFWITPARGRTLNKSAGSLSKAGYYSVTLLNVKYRRHRLIWIYHHGAIPKGMVVDHKDNDRQHDSIENLRLGTITENNRNKSKAASSNSPYKGVSWHSRDQRWESYIRIDGRQSHLGYYDCPVMAAERYDKAASEYYGQFAKPNFSADVLSREVA